MKWANGSGYCAQVLHGTALHRSSSPKARRKLSKLRRPFCLGQRPQTAACPCPSPAYPVHGIGRSDICSFIPPAKFDGAPFCMIFSLGQKPTDCPIFIFYMLDSDNFFCLLAKLAIIGYDRKVNRDCLDCRFSNDENKTMDRIKMRLCSRKISRRGTPEEFSQLR